MAVAQNQYPAGFPAALCPDYPFCSGGAAPAAPIPRQYPANVPAAACPDYPYCTTRSQAPVGYVNTAGYPAGLSAAACPNFPYC